MINFEPLSIHTWPQLEALFGENGACGGCWCMYWRLFHKEYEQKKGLENKQLLQQLIKDKQPLGVVAYQDENPVGWCSVSPKPTLVRLSKSRLYKHLEEIDDTWSITCLFIHKEYRHQNLSTQLISAASAYAFDQGAKVVEAYPIMPQKKNMPPVFAYVGFESAYGKAGFEKIKQVSPTRSVMRLKRI